MALDYYDILGVPPRAAAGEIRKAYRLLAQKWHPDKNPGDPWATGRFMRLGEAYRVLMDPVSRAAYDGLRTQERPGEGISPPSRQPAGGNPAAPPQSYSYRQPARPAPRGRGRGAGRTRRRKPPQPAGNSASKRHRNGVSGFFPWLPFLKDLPQRLLNWLTGRPPAGLEWEVVPTPHRPDLVMDLRLPRWLAARGTRINFIMKSHNQRRRLKLTIPPGVQEGFFMRVKGGGKAEGPVRGHLYINIRIKA